MPFGQPAEKLLLKSVSSKQADTGQAGGKKTGRLYAIPLGAFISTALRFWPRYQDDRNLTEEQRFESWRFGQFLHHESAFFKLHTPTPGGAWALLATMGASRRAREAATNGLTSSERFVKEAEHWWRAIVQGEHLPKERFLAAACCVRSKEPNTLLLGRDQWETWPQQVWEELAPIPEARYITSGRFIEDMLQLVTPWCAPGTQEAERLLRTLHQGAQDHKHSHSGVDAVAQYIVVRELLRIPEVCCQLVAQPPACGGDRRTIDEVALQLAEGLLSVAAAGCCDPHELHVAVLDCEVAEKSCLLAFSGWLCAQRETAAELPLQELARWAQIYLTDEERLPICHQSPAEHNGRHLCEWAEQAVQGIDNLMEPPILGHGDFDLQVRMPSVSSSTCVQDPGWGATRGVSSRSRLAVVSPLLESAPGAEGQTPGRTQQWHLSRDLEAIVAERKYRTMLFSEAATAENATKVMSHQQPREQWEARLCEAVAPHQNTFATTLKELNGKPGGPGEVLIQAQMEERDIHTKMRERQFKVPAAPVRSARLLQGWRTNNCDGNSFGMVPRWEGPGAIYQAPATAEAHTFLDLDRGISRTAQNSCVKQATAIALQRKRQLPRIAQATFSGFRETRLKSIPLDTPTTVGPGNFSYASQLVQYAPPPGERSAWSRQLRSPPSIAAYEDGKLPDSSFQALGHFDLQPQLRDSMGITPTTSIGTTRIAVDRARSTPLRRASKRTMREKALLGRPVVSSGKIRADTASLDKMRNHQGHSQRSRTNGIS